MTCALLARPWFGLALVTCHALCASHAWAQLPATAPVDSSSADTSRAGARDHFDRALELYRAGKYAGALVELERAARLDPDGKDLFFNLALVHEKLGQLPQAIAALERFRELEPDPGERERARVGIERLQGAEQVGTKPAPAAAPCPPPPAQPAARRPPSPVVLGAASLGLASLVVGAIFGLKALNDDVGDARTSASFSVEQLRERGRRASAEALVADLAFAVAGAAGGTAFFVWLFEPADAHARAAAVTLKGYF
jgi:tetratricopeptide (TPR) repeat protein